MGEGEAKEQGARGHKRDANSKNSAEKVK